MQVRYRDLRSLLPVLLAASFSAQAQTDTTPPTVAIIFPTSGETTSGTINLTMNASDNVGVWTVQFFIDGAAFAGEANFAAPPNRSFGAVWDTTTARNGAHTIVAEACDSPRNCTSSDPVTVTVSNASGSTDTTPPTVSITSPASGAIVSGTTSMFTSASDNVGVAAVRFEIDGVLLFEQRHDPTVGSPNDGFTWVTTSGSKGSHTLTAVARDAAGNTTTSAPVTVTVFNFPSGPTDTTLPTVAITSPAPGAAASGTVSVDASASDNVGVVAVQFKLDGVNLWEFDAPTGAPPPLGPTLRIHWDTTTASNGSHTLTAVARDAAGNTQTSAPIAVTVSNNTPARDPLKWPFASTSIWNMPIGSNAVYAPANIPAIFDEPDTPVDEMEWASMPSVDWDIIVLTPTAPLTDINHSSAEWTGADRCDATDDPPSRLFRLPMPSNFIVPNGLPGTPNGSAAFLKPDGRTLIQTQPFTRCVAGEPGTTSTNRFFFPPVDLYGDGIKGSHGGSGLSAIGGSLRLGELRPGSQEGPRHALKLNVYSALILYDCSDSVFQSDCYRWPADRADIHAAATYGSKRLGNSPEMKMGALLAIPASVNLSTMGLETEPGKQLAWTLQNYGAYINDTQEVQAFTFDAESGPGPDGLFTSFKAQFEADYGFPLEQSWRGTSGNTSLWSSDMQKLMTALHVVTNNGPSSIGGGGTPRQPLAPPLALTRFDQDGNLGPPGATVSASPNGAWVQRGADIAAFNDGSATSSDVAGATVQFTFTGTAVTWIGLKCNICGIANVSIDGGAATSVNTAGAVAPGNPDLWSEAVFTASGLAAGTHNLVITVTGTTTSDAAHVVVDAFDVTP